MHEIELTREERELLQSSGKESRRASGEVPGSASFARGDDLPREPLDIRRELEVLEAFHHNVAERFADALSRAVQRLVEVQLVDVQAMTYSQFAFGRARPTCYLVLQATPLPASLALDVNPDLLYPILDALLGGGKHPCACPTRAPTELEQRLAQRVVRSLLDELHDAWEPLLAVDLSIDRIESDAQRVRVVAPGDGVIVLAFEVRLSDQTGIMSLCLPQRAIRKIVDKLLVGEFMGSGGAKLSTSVSAEDTVELTAHFDAQPISPLDLDNLREGDMLPSDLDADGLVEVSLDGRLAFHARPGALHGHRAIVLGNPIAPARSDH
jgi:flagellar motor switch protein FliM